VAPGGARTLNVRGAWVRDPMFVASGSGGPGHVLDSLSRQPGNRAFHPAPKGGVKCKVN
jgi:hypothetical protein